MNRRTFVFSASLGLAGVALLQGCGPDQSSPSSLALIWERETIVEMGVQYRAQFPEEDDKSKLLDLLTREGSQDFDAMVKEDFDAGRHVLLDGWIISVTEARQCALLSIDLATA